VDKLEKGREQSIKTLSKIKVPQAIPPFFKGLFRLRLAEAKGIKGGFEKEKL
jgi:hypothetical protein